MSEGSPLPLFGRSRELAVLRQLLEDAVQGAGRAAVVGIVHWTDFGFRVIDSAIVLLERLSGMAPVVVAFEDLHWADPATLRAIRVIGRALPRLPPSLAIDHGDRTPNVVTFSYLVVIRRRARRTPVTQGGAMRPRVSIPALFGLLTVLLFALGPVATAAPSENYGDYSLMTQRHAGQFYSDGSAAGQWSWTPQGNDESEVLWGDPSKWPPDSAEHFIHVGDWVLLDGWRSFGTYYVQRVNRELIGDGSCQNMVLLPSDGGRQHYVQWKIPSRAYCLQAWGTITDSSSGKTVDFSHSQLWSPPSPCRNTYLGGQTCIRQWESWADNNGDPGGAITRKLERSVYLARGIGMGFVIDQSYPHSWHAELHSDWLW